MFIQMFLDVHSSMVCHLSLGHLDSQALPGCSGAHAPRGLAECGRHGGNLSPRAHEKKNGTDPLGRGGVGLKVQSMGVHRTLLMGVQTMGFMVFNPQPRLVQTIGPFLIILLKGVEPA